jgi:hypothetical protein
VFNDLIREVGSDCGFDLTFFCSDLTFLPLRDH